MIQPRGHKFWLTWGLLALLLTLGLQLPRWIEYSSFLTDPMQTTADSRQWIVPYMQPAPERDYASHYYRSMFMPAAMDKFYSAISSVADLNMVARYIGIALLICTIVFASATVWALAGPWAALACMAYMVSTAAVSEITLQALPRSYALPLVAASLLAASRRRWGLMAAITVLAGFIYPVVAVISGVWLSGCLLFDITQEGRWRLHWRKKHVLLIACTGIITLVALLAPGRWHSDSYGSLITPSMIGDYPEIGLTGRYQLLEIMQSQSPLTSLKVSAHLSLTGNGEALVPWLDLRWLFTSPYSLIVMGIVGVFIALGLHALYQNGKRHAAFLAIITSIGVFFCYAIAWLFMPYAFLPDRYIAYTLPVLLPVWVICAIEGFCRMLLPTLSTLLWWRFPLDRTLYITLLAVPVLCLGGDGLHHNDDGSYSLHGDIKTVRVPPELQQALRQLPDNAVIAGWPEDMMDDVAYLSRKPIWLHYKTHQAYHTAYTLEMRRRMMLLMDAMFSPDPAALEKLRQEGVTHMLIHRTLYNRSDPPRYFSPFDEYLRARWHEWHGQLPAVLQLPSSSRMYEYRDWTLVSLLPPDNAGLVPLGSHSPAGTIVIDAGSFLHNIPKGDLLIDEKQVHGAENLFDHSALIVNSKENAVARVNIPETGTYWLFVHSLGGSESSFSVTLGDKTSTHIFGRNDKPTLENGGSFTLSKGELDVTLGDIKPSPLLDAIIITKNSHFRASDLATMQFPAGISLLKEFHVPPHVADICFGPIDKGIGFAVLSSDWSVSAFDHEGHALWHYDAPIENSFAREEALPPCLMWDFEHRGTADLVHWRVIDGKEWLVVADGKTGEIKRKVEWHVAALPHDYHHFQLAIAALHPGYPQDILTLTDTGDATSIAAYDANLTPLWTYQGPDSADGLGRALYPVPLTKDGPEAIAANNVLLDASGKIIWSHEDAIKDHRARSNDIKITVMNGKPVLIVAQNDNGVSAYDAKSGDMLWQSPANNARQLIFTSGKTDEPILVGSHLYEDSKGKPSNFSQLYQFSADGKQLSLWPQNSYLGTVSLAQGDMLGNGSLMRFWGQFVIHADGTGTLFFPQPIYRVFDFMGNGAEQAITLDKEAGILGIYGLSQTKAGTAKREIDYLRSVATPPQQN